MWFLLTSFFAFGGFCMLLFLPTRPVKYNRLLPCTQHILPARIEHMLVEQEGNIVDIVSTALALPPA